MSAPDTFHLISPGWDQPRRIEIGRTTQLGSGPEAEIRVQGEGIAPIHCAIEWAEGTPTLIDRSGGGAPPRPLYDGAEITLGAATRIRVRHRASLDCSASAPVLCHVCHEPLSELESRGGGRYRLGPVVLCRRCVWSGHGDFPLVAGLRLIHKLGGGMTATVHEAHDWKSGRRVAIKLLPTALPGQTKKKLRYRLERLKRELALSSRLRHPNILRTYRIGREANHLYMIMEYAEGADWQRLLTERAGPYDPSELQHSLQDLGSALDYAHHEGVIHRDIKPGNILINTRGFVKVTDFGLARDVMELSLLTRTGAVLGTLPFASPEQLLDPRAVNVRSDVYSLAATVYCLLTGTPPFTYKNHYRLLKAIRGEIAPRLSEHRPDLPAHIGEALARSLAKDPEDRAASAGELISQLLC